MIISRGLKKMDYLKALSKQQIFLLKSSIKSNEWKIYKEYLKNIVFAYLNTTESKDFLKGIKYAVVRFEEDLERI